MSNNVWKLEFSLTSFLRSCWSKVVHVSVVFLLSSGRQDKNGKLKVKHPNTRIHMKIVYMQSQKQTLQQRVRHMDIC